MSPEDRRAKQAPLTATGPRLKATGSRCAYFFPLGGGGFLSAARPFCASLASLDLG
jgi:hypothetical protein